MPEKENATSFAHSAKKVPSLSPDYHSMHPMAQPSKPCAATIVHNTTASFLKSPQRLSSVSKQHLLTSSKKAILSSSSKKASTYLKG
jgi:hypothetical protein